MEKKLERLNIFPVPVYKVNINREITEDEHKGIELATSNCITNRSNLTTFDNFVLNTYTNFEDIKSFIQKNLNIYVKEAYDFTGDQSIKITQSWINITLRNKHHHKHKHSNSLVSGVFYINTIKDDGILLFDEKRDSGFHVGEMENKSGMYPKIKKVKVKTGDLILFPSWLEHGVQDNTTDKDRISLSFNTQPKGEFGNKTSLTYVEY